jgi:hypothetical protein
MKKILFISSLLLLAACNSNINIQDDRIWDFSNPDVVFFIRNAAGENLLDPNVEGNILDNEITVEYDDQIYGLNGAGTRANKDVWYGLRVEPYSDVLDDTPVLKFGEFRTSTHSDFRGEAFTLNWGDGTSDEVKFDLYVTWKGLGNKREPTVHKKIWLNGKLQSDDSLTVTIVK